MSDWMQGHWPVIVVQTRYGYGGMNWCAIADAWRNWMNKQDDDLWGSDIEAYEWQENCPDWAAFGETVQGALDALQDKLAA